MEKFRVGQKSVGHYLLAVGLSLVSNVNALAGLNDDLFSEF